MSEENKTVELKEDDLKNVSGGDEYQKTTWYAAGMACPRVERNGIKCRGTLVFLGTDLVPPSGSIERYQCNVCGNQVTNTHFHRP